MVTHWDLPCKLKTTGCEPAFWKHGEVSGCHSVLVAGSFTKDRMLRLDSEASRKVCWEEEGWQRSTLGTRQTAWGDTASAHWLPLTVLLAALQLASDWFCLLRKHSSVINLRKKWKLLCLGWLVCTKAFLWPQLCFSFCCSQGSTGPSSSPGWIL